MKSKHRTKAQKMHAQVQRQKAAVEQQYSYRASNTRGAEVKMSPSVPVARSFSSISPATSLSTAPTMPADKKDYAHQLFAYDTALIYGDLRRTMIIVSGLFVLLGGIFWLLTGHLVK
jgi:hypothetical protein